MTCIVGVEHGGRVYLGGDSFAGGDNESMAMVAAKVHRAGPCVLGHAGSARRAQVIRHLCAGRSFDVPRVRLERWVFTTLVPHFAKAIRKAGLQPRAPDGGFGPDSGESMIGVRGELYYIACDDALHRQRCGYGASGSGAEVALGVLYATRGKEPRLRIRTALAAAAEHTSVVRRPWRILATPEDK